uniref:Chromosome 1 open reading frame 48 n=1 Tax=Mesocestoides corti TaxID=53468 RepID=A0A5K3EK37_MESCO
MKSSFAVPKLALFEREPCHTDFADIMKPCEKNVYNTRTKFHPSFCSSTGKTDGESFEVLDYPSPLNRSYRSSLSEKSESGQADSLVLFPPPYAASLADMSAWLAYTRLPPAERDTRHLFPPTLLSPANMSLWLSAPAPKKDHQVCAKSQTCKNEWLCQAPPKPQVDTLEAKLEAMALAQEKDEDKEVDNSEVVALVCRKPNKGDSCCKSFGNCANKPSCATRLMDEVEKPCIRAWLARQSVLPAQLQAELEGEQSEPRDPAVVAQLRKTAKSDLSLWLAKNRSEEPPRPSGNRMTFVQHHLEPNWRERWLKRHEPLVAEMLDSHVAKKSKLANLLLDSQKNLEADLEAIVYQSPFKCRTTASYNWLHTSKKAEAVEQPCGRAPCLSGVTTTFESD